MGEAKNTLLGLPIVTSDSIPSLKEGDIVLQRPCVIELVAIDQGDSQPGQPDELSTR